MLNQNRVDLGIAERVMLSEMGYYFVTPKPGFVLGEIPVPDVPAGEELRVELQSFPRKSLVGNLMGMTSYQALTYGYADKEMGRRLSQANWCFFSAVPGPGVLPCRMFEWSDDPIDRVGGWIARP
jgi:hypothetical protein